MYRQLAAPSGPDVWFDPESLDYGIGAEPDPGTPGPGVGALLDRVRAQTTSRPIRRLMVAHTMQCNMTCTYCYNELDLKAVRGSESAGSADPERLRTRLLAAVADAPASGLAVTFVGGEPLFDRRGLERLVDDLRGAAHDRGLPLSLGMYTNGLLMTRALVAWAHRTDVSLVVSLDGPPLEHDRSRRTVGGGPTARRILDNVRHLVETSDGRPTRVRAVASEGTDLLLLHRYLLALGFNEIHVQPAYGSDGTARLDVDAHRRIMDWYTSHLLAGRVLDVAPYAGHLLRLAQRGRAIQTHFPCDVGVFSAALDPRGDVYPCHHFFGEPGFRYPVAGATDLPSPTDLAARARPVDERPVCRSCVARHLCGGECYHRASVAGTGYFGVVPSECEVRRDLVAPIVRMFDTVMRRGGDTMRRLVHGDLTPVPPDPAAYACTSLDDVAGLVAP